jgi:hypothetical protein
MPQNSLNQEESQVNHQEHLSSGSTENHQIEGFSTRFEGKDHQEKIHTNLMVIPNTNPATKHLQNLPTKITRKGSENHQKGRMREASRTLWESHQTLYIP